MDTVRWGLLSTANINRALIPAIREAKRSELTAVASRTLESAENYARDWEIPQAFGSYEEMLKSGFIPPRNWSLNYTSSWVNFYRGLDNFSKSDPKSSSCTKK